MGGKDCDDLLDELAHLLHGELPADRQATLRAHLDDCPPCMESADFQAKLRSMIAARCQEDVPVDLHAKVAKLLAGGSPTGEPIS